jgi:hypothetical protein
LLEKRTALLRENLAVIQNPGDFGPTESRVSIESPAGLGDTIESAL